VLEFWECTILKGNTAANEAYWRNGGAMAIESGVDRVTIRKRPAGMPIMYQSWCKLLFMHWRLPPELLRPHVPPQLEIDTFDGDAWIGVTPFTVRKARPPFLPPLPLLSAFDEINVRTYVHYKGVPGVWFFSLDASSAMAVMGARAAYHLPYYTAEMRLKEEDGRILYQARRLSSPQPVQFQGAWKKGEMVGEAAVGSLEFFLVERYCLYALEGDDLYRARIFHPPWKLQRAELISCHSTMLEGQKLPKPDGAPLLHYSEKQDTAIWPIHKVS
jgi:uncharacterized protein